MSSALFSAGAVVMMLILFFYMFIGSVLEKYHCSIGHEASLVILFGLALSFLSLKSGHEEFNEFVIFDENIFFYFCLPPIVFASGYNMKRKKFFENFVNILLFGLVGTVVQFTLFSFFTYVVVQFDIMWKYNGHSGEYEQFTLSVMEILLMCSLLCCTDVVAAISIIKYEEQPKLFSLVFGEGITNDAVCIILFNTVMEFAGPGSEFTGTTPLLILYSFLRLSFWSIFIGIALALISGLFTKHFRFITVKPTIECTLIFCFGYLSYCVAELFHFSGIISLLASGILMSKYTWYNLSQQAKQATSLAFNVIGYAVEAFVFGYLGLTFFAYVSFEWSWQLFIAELIIIILGRFMGTIGIIKFLEIFKYKSGIRFKDLIFISYAGMIRGAVAFGLVLRIDQSIPNRSVIVTTSLALVVFTTVVLGSTVATVQKCLFGKEQEAAAALKKAGMGDKAKHILEGEDADQSHHEIVEHPNFEDIAEKEMTPSPMAGEQQQQQQTQKKKKNRCIEYVRRFDADKLRPFLIYKYDREQHKLQKRINELLINKGDKLEEIFANEEQPVDGRKSQLYDILTGKMKNVESDFSGMAGKHSQNDSHSRDKSLGASSSNQIRPKGKSPRNLQKDSASNPLLTPSGKKH